MTSGLRIRPAQPADRQSVHRVVEAAFGDEGKVAELVEALAPHVTASLVAEVRGAVVGHVQLNRSWVDARERLVPVVVLSPLSVAPDHQRAGIGRRLVEAALAVAGEEAEPAVFLEGSPEFYGRLGFERASAHGFGRPSERIPDAAFQVVVLDDSIPVGPVVYCDPFWATDSVGLRDPLLAELEARPD
jgi:putative acetyltransferase